MAIEERRNWKKKKKQEDILGLMTWEEAVYLNVNCVLFFLVNWILMSLAFTQDQTSGGIFFIGEIFTQVLTPCNWTEVSVIKSA